MGFKMVKESTQIAKTILQNVNKVFVMELLEKVNLTTREKQILIDSELEHKTIKEISIEKNISLSYVSVLKRKAVEKIYKYNLSTKLL